MELMKILGYDFAVKYAKRAYSRIPILLMVGQI